MSKIYSRPRIRIPILIGKNIRGRNSKKQNKIVFIFLIFLIAFITVQIVINAISPIFDNLCKDRAKSIATLVSNEQANVVMQKYEYDDFFSLEKDKDGNIKMIKSNVNSINAITSDVALNIQSKINDEGKENIGIPLGSLTGIKFLSGMGYNIPIKVSTIGNVETELKSEFVEKGINQTLHRVYLQVDTEVNILTPYNTISEEIKNQILIAENVIIGNIPQTYYNINGTNLEQSTQFVK